MKDYTTSRVLTMDYIRGLKITSLSPLAQTEVNGGRLAEELFRAYFEPVADRRHLSRRPAFPATCS